MQSIKYRIIYLFLLLNTLFYIKLNNIKRSVPYLKYN